MGRLVGRQKQIPVRLHCEKIWPVSMVRASRDPVTHREPCLTTTFQMIVQLNAELLALVWGDDDAATLPALDTLHLQSAGPTQSKEWPRKVGEVVQFPDRGEFQDGIFRPWTIEIKMKDMISIDAFFEFLNLNDFHITWPVAPQRRSQPTPQIQC